VLKMAALILSVVYTGYSDSLFIYTVCNDNFFILKNNSVYARTVGLPAQISLQIRVTCALTFDHCQESFRRVAIRINVDALSNFLM